jgi:GNAT superfamily N-acetyltransferase
MIRPGKLSDLEFIVRGNREMARETESLELEPAILTEGVRAVLAGEQPGGYWILEEDGAPIAQLMITYEWSDWRNRMVWWIQSVFVEPKHRQSGCFRRLYQAVRDEARAAGAGGLRLYVDERNQRAQAVYRALGMNGDHYRVFEDMF